MAMQENKKEPSKGEKTRERILALAEASVLEKGFDATSIDELTAAADITKSGFLYHFSDKTDLARQLLQRYLVQDEIFMDALFDRADELSSDPLHSFLIFARLFGEAMDDAPNVHPGCIVASYTYQDRLFSDDIRALNREGILRWRNRFTSRFELISEAYPPKGDVDLVALADYVSTIIEGGIIMSRALGDKSIMMQQIMLGRDHVKRIFQPD